MKKTSTPTFSGAGTGAGAAIAGLLALCAAGGLAAAAAMTVLKGHTSGVADIAWHPGGALLASAGSDGQVIVWKVDAAGAGAKVKALAGFGKRGTRAVSFRPPKGDHLAIGDAAGALHVYATDTWARVFSVGGLGDEVDRVDYSPDGNELAVGSGENALVLAVPEYTRDRAYKIPPLLTELTWSPTSELLGMGSLDGTASIAPRRGEVGKAVLPGHSGGVSDVAFAPDGRTVCTVDAHGSVRLWDVLNAKMLSEPLAATGVRAWEAAWSPDSAFVAVGMADGKVHVYSAASGTEVKVFEPTGGPARHVAFSPDGRMLATTTTGRLQIWRADTGAEVANIAEHREAISALVWAPDSRRLATASDDDTVRIWVAPGP